MSIVNTDITSHKRNNYFDFLRAIAIIMVMGNHTCSVADFSFPSGLGNIAILQIVKSGVPIFLAISAFFLCPRTITGKDSYFRFLIKHLKRVYIPMIIFSLPFIFGNGFGLRSVVGRTALTLLGAYSVYYFIFLIAQYYILLPILQRKAIHLKGVIVCATISCISILGITYCNSIRGMDLPLFIYAGSFPVWIVFFALGCYISKNRDRFNINNGILYILFFLALIASIIGTCLLNKYYTDGGGIKLSVFILSAIIILILFSKKFEFKYNKQTGPITGTLNLIGRLSFTIYLCHVYFITLLSNYHFLTSNWYLNWLIVSIVSISAVALADRILPKQIGKYVGL